VSEPKLPSRAEALSLLIKAGCSRRVIEHCRAVSHFAIKIAKAYHKKGVNVDIKLVEVSALLHDVGRSKTHTVDHAIVGADIARSFGLLEEVAQIIERHAGGGIPREEAKQLGWPARDYLPRTLEEKIVCYADKRVEGLRTVPIERAIKGYAASLGEKHPAIERIRKLHQEILAGVGEAP